MSAIEARKADTGRLLERALRERRYPAWVCSLTLVFWGCTTRDVDLAAEPELEIHLLEIYDDVSAKQMQFDEGFESLKTVAEELYESQVEQSTDSGALVSPPVTARFWIDFRVSRGGDILIVTLFTDGQGQATPNQLSEAAAGQMRRWLADRSVLQ